MKLPFFGKEDVNITQANITYNTSKHTYFGMKAKRDFTYKLPFSNSEVVSLRILNIEVSDPFELKKLNYNLPINVSSGQKLVFELKCRFKGDYAYNGPIEIKINALPMMGAAMFDSK